MSKIIDELKNGRAVNVNEVKILSFVEISDLLYDIVCMIDENKKLKLQIESFESLENNLRKTLYWEGEEIKDLKEDIRELEHEKEILLSIIVRAMKNE